MLIDFIGMDFLEKLAINQILMTNQQSGSTGIPLSYSSIALRGELVF